MDTVGGVEARDVPLSAAKGSRVSAASSCCDVAAGARELGAETAKGNANTNAFLPQRRRGKAERNANAD